MSYGHQTARPDIKFETKPVIPIFTALIVFLFVVSYAQTIHNFNIWVDTNVFEVNTIMAKWKAQQFSDMFKLLATATFAQGHWILCVLNSYFIWCFGSSLEQKLGAPRFLMIVVIGMFLPWAFMCYDTYRLQHIIHYFGPGLMIATLVGACLVFPPDRKVVFGQMFKPRGEIFKKDEETDITAKYAFDPKKYLAIWILYEVAAHAWVTRMVPILPKEFNSDVDTARLIPMLMALGAGYGLVALAVYSATGSLKDGPIKLMAIKRYQELLKLDVSHEEALLGTAFTLGLPQERVKDWVQKQKGKMSIS